MTLWVFTHGYVLFLLNSRKVNGMREDSRQSHKQYFPQLLFHTTILRPSSASLFTNTMGKL